MEPSKQVVDRSKDATAVAASVETHATAVASGLSRVLEPHLEADDQMPDLELALRLIGRMITARSQAMTLSDKMHQTELADDAAPRGERDRLADDLASRIAVMRETLEGVYGAAAIREYGITGRTPRSDPARLVAFAESLAELLETDPLPPARIRASVDPRELAAELRTLIPPLAAALGEVAREAREAEGTLVVRNDAMESFDRAFGRGAGALAALYRLAGEVELGARIRPSPRRAGRLASPDEAGDEMPGESAEVPEPDEADPAV